MKNTEYKAVNHRKIFPVIISLIMILELSAVAATAQSDKNTNLSDMAVNSKLKASASSDISNAKNAFQYAGSWQNPVDNPIGRGNTEWLALDFGEKVTFNSISVNEYGRRIRKFNIQISDDGNVWKTVYKGIDDCKVSAQESWDEFLNIKLNEPVTARHFSIVFETLCEGHIQVPIGQILIYNNPDFAPTETLEEIITAREIAHGLPEKAYFSSSSAPGQDAKYAFDSDGESVWQAVGQYLSPQWIAVDFGKKVKFSRVDFTQYNNRAKLLKIQYSDEGNSWNSAFYGNIANAKDDGGKTSYTVTFPAAEGRFLRIYFEKTAGNSEGTEIQPALFNVNVFDFREDAVTSAAIKEIKNEARNKETVMYDGTGNVLPAGVCTDGKNETSAGTGTGSTGTLNAIEINISENSIKIPSDALKTQKWVAADIKLTAEKRYENPYKDQKIECVFNGPQGQKITIPGFWDGADKWKVRFAPYELGKWTYTVTAEDTSDKGLNGITGELYCTEYNGSNEIYRHGFLRVNNGKRGLTYADGTPFFWLADTHWMGLTHRETLYSSNSGNYSSMFKGMADIRARQGYTVYQMNLFLSENGGNGTLNGLPATWNEGGRVWVQYKKWELPNAKFFANCDERIEYLAERDIVSAIGLDWGNNAYNSTLVNNYKEIARYIVARFSAYPVVWLTCGEAAENSPYWAEIAKYIDEIDPYSHPTTLHSGVEGKDFGYACDEYRGEPWYDFVMMQSGHINRFSASVKNRWLNQYGKSPVIPFIEGETCYEGIHSVSGLTRRMAYTSIMCGGFGFSYGAEGIWNATFDENDDFQIWSDSPIPWYEAIDAPEGQQMEYMKKAFMSTPFWEMKPNNSIAVWGANIKEVERPLVKSNSDNSSVIIYYPQTANARNNSFIADINGLLENSVYYAEWHNPVNGEITDIGAFNSGADGTYRTPATPTGYGDWILILNESNIAVGETALKEAADGETLKFPGSRNSAGIPVNRVNIEISSEENAPTDLAIDIKMHDGSFVRTAELHGDLFKGNKNLTVDFESKNAVSVRVTFNNGRNNNSADISEINVYYMPDSKSGNSIFSDASYGIPDVSSADANKDLIADSNDLIYIKKVLIGIAENKNIDLNCDGFTDIRDLIAAKKIILSV